MQTGGAGGTTSAAVQPADATAARRVPKPGDDCKVMQSTGTANTQATPRMTITQATWRSGSSRRASETVPSLQTSSLMQRPATTAALRLWQSSPPDASSPLTGCVHAATPPSVQRLPTSNRPPAYSPRSRSSPTRPSSARTAAPQTRCDDAHRGCHAKLRLTLAVCLEGLLIDGKTVERIVHRWPEVLQRKLAKVAASMPHDLRLINGSTWVKLRPGCMDSLSALSARYDLILVRASGRVDAAQKLCSPFSCPAHEQPLRQASNVKPGRDLLLRICALARCHGCKSTVGFGNAQG